MWTCTALWEVTLARPKKKKFLDDLCIYPLAQWPHFQDSSLMIHRGEMLKWFMHKVIHCDIIWDNKRLDTVQMSIIRETGWISCDTFTPRIQRILSSCDKDCGRCVAMRPSLGSTTRWKTQGVGLNIWHPIFRVTMGWEGVYIGIQIVYFCKKKHRKINQKTPKTTQWQEKWLLMEEKHSRGTAMEVEFSKCILICGFGFGIR